MKRLPLNIWKITNSRLNQFYAKAFEVKKLKIDILHGIKSSKLKELNAENLEIGDVSNCWILNLEVFKMNWFWKETWKKITFYLTKWGRTTGWNIFEFLCQQQNSKF